MGFDTEESEVEELVLFATSSSEPVYKAMRQAAYALGKRQYQGTYEEPKALILMKHIADLAAQQYAIEFGNGRQNRREWSSMFPPKIRAATARELLRRWVQPHIDVDIKPELEAKYGRKPISGGGHGLPAPDRHGPTAEQRIYDRRRQSQRGRENVVGQARRHVAEVHHLAHRPPANDTSNERRAPPPVLQGKSKKRLGRSELKAVVRDVAPHFFDAKTMRFFNSRLESDGYVGRDGYVYFVTSEQFQPSEGPAHAREYKVRRVTAVGVRVVDTVKHKADAIDMAKQLATEG